MSRCVVLVLFFALGLAFRLSHGVEVSVNNKDNKLCLYANLMVNFSVMYETVGSKNETVEFALPANVTTNGSLCENTKSVLKLQFGDGHSWTVAFTNDGKTYQADSILFAYNLNDSATFPDSTSHETMTLTVKPHITHVDMDTCYSCKSKDVFQSNLVNQTLWNVLIQAFVTNGSKSENFTTCAADLPTTTVAPTTHVTNATTAAPATNSTTVPISTTTPTPSLPNPAIGNYSIKSDGNGTICLLANFGLRIGFTQGQKYEEMNFDPANTTVNGFCGVNSSELVLISKTISIVFSFTSDGNKFHLHALNVTVMLSPHEVFSDMNSNLALWEASNNSSYMCHSKQNYNITKLLSLFTFDLQVQPFGVKEGCYSTAHECSMDDTSILIPIVVGAALAGLILIVVIAYVIGRRKTYVGYQTL
ncbi:hypothetical protein LDENG_00273670 [Lucifuga dentata]|nr:hypothetical protein LDENG_00273670 [Lucifuga dentata]